jgi:PAS domain-containing protein
MCGIGNDEDVTKLKIYDFHPEWTNKMFAEEILPAAVRDGTWTGECAFLDIRDRHEIPVSMVFSSHKASNGEVEAFSTISRDITERKQAEEKLRETSQYLENLFNYANAPIIVWDPQFKITRFNHAFEALTGRSSHDVIGKSIKILFPTDKVESSMEFIRETL